MRETVFDNGLRVPDELHAILDRVLEPFAVAEATGDPSDVNPFLSRREFDCLMLSVDEIHDSINAVSTVREDRDRILSLAWERLPGWAKSRQAFENRWRIRDLNPAHSISYGFVRSNINEVIGLMADEGEALPAMKTA